MTRHPAPDPADLTALAAAAFDRSRSAAERDELIRKLMGPLRGMAWRLARPDHDHAEELRSHVLVQCERGCYDPAQGPFPAWCRVVMTRRLMALRDPRKRGLGGREPLDTTDARPPVANDERATPFGPADLARVRRWKPRQRLVLLARSLLWPRIPAGDWAATVAAAGLAEPFPEPGFEDLDPAGRNAALAAALGVPVNTIHVNMKRWRHLLLDLRFVRDLGPQGRSPSEPGA